MLHRIQKATFFEQKFVADLQLGSKSVNKINDVFTQLYDQLALVSFWESRETRGVGVLSYYPETDVDIGSCSRIFCSFGI